MGLPPRCSAVVVRRVREPRLCWQARSIKVSEWIQQPIGFDLSLCESAGSHSLYGS
jgi:hypothetical protein